MVKCHYYRGGQGVISTFEDDVQCLHLRVGIKKV